MMTSAEQVGERERLAGRVRRIGRAVAVAGVVLPLLLIGGLKFTAFEAEALVPLISSAPWMAWMYTVFGESGTSYLIGAVEITAALLIVLAVRWPFAGVVGGTLAALIFLGTTSLLLVAPIWEPAAGGFPALGGMGQFLIKDIALLGISLTVLAESMLRSVASRRVLTE
jgi:uncharacterized membrane protein YkgB